MAVRDFLLPDLGEGLEDAEVLAWRVAVGDTVELNQTLVEVNTAKALVEIPAPWPGTVAALHAGEGDVVRVGQPLVSIEVQGEAADEERPKREPLLVGYGVAVEEDAPRRAGGGTPRASREGGAPVAASPPVRRLAKQLGVDLGTVAGTGPGGRVTREDVESAAAGGTGEQERAADEDVEVVPVKGTRRLIAEKMARSAREIPHVTTFLTVDATEIQALREELAAEAGARVSPLPIVVRALVEVCREHPLLNASFDADGSRIRVFRRQHVGIATDTARGLLVPVVHDAHERGILELAGEIARLSTAARSGSITLEEMAGGTITVTNVGSFGAEFGTPIINHPEAAILALGVLEPRALVVDGRVEARPAVTLSLSFDHRVLDGAEAGRALAALAELVQSPSLLRALPR